MWSDSTYGGGGFLDSTNAAQSPAKKNTQVRKLQSVVPVVVRQLEQLGEHYFKLFGFQVQIVTLVGILRSFDVQSTKATCELEDHTGNVLCVLWLENDDGGTITNMPEVKEGTYVQVFGSLRNQDGVRMVMILRMLPVTDSNAVISHLLHTVRVRLEAETMSKQGAGARLPNTALAESMSALDEDRLGGGGTAGFTTVQQKVYNTVLAVDTASGLHRTAILQQFPGNQAREVNQALNFLVNEGHIYSTIDHDHFKATDV